MATITTDTYLDGGTARTAGETWTMNGGKLTVRTDTRWHANAPASMTGSLGSLTISSTLGGGVLFDGRNVRWIEISGGSGTPAIGDTISQGGVSGYYLGFWSSLTAAPSATIGASGFIKLREVTGGSFAAGALTFSGAGAATAVSADRTGWIEVVMDQSGTITTSRKGTGSVTRGDWFYLDDTNGSVGQVIQTPTNGGGANTFAPGLWVETAPGTDTYEFWPGLNGSTNGWAVQNLGMPTGSTDRRQSFVKSTGSGQVQIGEAYTSASLTYTITSSSGTYTWANDIVTVSLATHGYSVGESVHLTFTSGGASASGIYQVTQVTGTGTFTVDLGGYGASGNVTIRGRATISQTANVWAVGNLLRVNSSSGDLEDGVYEIISKATDSFVIACTPSAGTGGNCVLEMTIGRVPEAGCKTRIPNVILRQCTTGARATNAAPNATVATRPDFTTTGAGIVDHEYTYGDWYYLTLQAYQTRLQHVATYDQISVSECATSIEFEDVGTGMHSALDAVSLILLSNFAGGSIFNSKFLRGNTPGTGDHAITVTTCLGIAFQNTEAGIIQYARSTGYGLALSQSSSIVVQGCRFLNAGTISVATCSNTTIVDIDWVDRIIGYTNATSATYCVSLSAKCNNIVVDHITEGYDGLIERQHAYAGLLNAGACDNVKLRSCGSLDAVLGTSTVKINDRGVIYASGGNNFNIAVQQCYVSSVRTNIITDVNTDKKVLYESVSAPHLSTFMPFTLAVAALNATIKGVTSPLNTVAANASVYGTHMYDQFTSWFRMLSTYTWSSNIVTVTSPTHGLSVGDKVYLKFTSGDGDPSGVYTVKTITSATVFTVSLAGSGASGNVIAWRNLSNTPDELFNVEGVIALPMNEATNETNQYIAITGNPQFTSTPGLTFPALNDEVVFSSPYRILGHDSFLQVPVTMTGIPTVAQASTYTWSANVLTVTFTAHGLLAGDYVYLDFTSGGGTPDGLYQVASVTSANVYTIALAGSGASGNVSVYRHLWLRYKINTGSGYGEYHNLSKRVSGGATTSGSPTITMMSTSGLEVGDYIYGIGVGVDAQIHSIDSATQITATVDSVATGNTLVLEFNHIPNETISAQDGFELRVSIKADTPGSTMVITYLTVPTVTSAASKYYLYPLDVSTLTLTGLVPGSDIVVLVAGTDTERANVDAYSETSYDYIYENNDNIDIGVFKSGYVPFYIRSYQLNGDPASLPINQVADRNYLV